MKFEYTITKKEAPAVIIDLKGELIDKSQAADLVTDTDDLLEHGFNRIILTMADLKYLNSSGLNVLINLLTKARKTGGEVVMTNLSPKVSQLMLITRLNAVFQVTDDLESALTRMATS